MSATTSTKPITATVKIVRAGFCQFGGIWGGELLRMLPLALGLPGFLQ